MSEAERKLDLSRIVFIGRTFEEYMRMFDLREEDLPGRRILDCPAGACSFTAIANRRGARVTAADIAYAHPIDRLAAKGREDIEHVTVGMEQAHRQYVWDFFRSIEGLRNHRTQALTDCVRDMETFPDRYVPATLPVLPFADQTFDLTLSAHFLFMYGDRLDFDFHVRTVRELLRVTQSEIRLFPLTDLAGNRSAHLDGIVDFIRGQGCRTEEVQVSYEFQKGANRMLVIRKV